MKIQTANAIASALDMLSFLFLNKEAAQRVQAIYLFGSAVRGELQPKSDLDLFVECRKEDEEKIKRFIDSAILKFTSSPDYKKWKLYHFTYPFAVQVGQLAEWDLKLSIASEGILLYNKAPAHSLGERSVLFMISYPPQKKGYIRLRRLLFGRDEPQYQEQGIIANLHGQKLSSHVFIIPTEEQARMIDLLSELKITFSMKEIVLLRG